MTKPIHLAHVPPPLTLPSGIAIHLPTRLPGLRERLPLHPPTPGVSGSRQSGVKLWAREPPEKGCQFPWHCWASQEAWAFWGFLGLLAQRMSPPSTTSTCSFYRERPSADQLRPHTSFLATSSDHTCYLSRCLLGPLISISSSKMA